jgi:DNA polymerase (family 10)
MAEGAAQRGYKYIAVVDSGGDAGLIERRLRARHALNAELEGSMRIFNAMKVSVNEEGKIPYPDSLLDQVDFVVASFDDGNLSDPPRLTRRMLLAIAHSRVTIVTVPLSAGQAGDKDPCNFDLPAVCRAAREHGVAFEVDARPNRFGAAESYLREAKDLGVRFAIGTHAQSPADLANMRYGLAVAQRGWLTPQDVINTWPLDEIRRFSQKSNVRSEEQPNEGG